MQSIQLLAIVVVLCAAVLVRAQNDGRYVNLGYGRTTARPLRVTQGTTTGQGRYRGSSDGR